MSKDNSGSNNPMFGKHHSEEAKLKMGQSHKGKGTGKNPNKSHPHTEEWKKQHSIDMLGKNNPAYGKKLPEERKDKISNSLIGRFFGEDSANWKGGKKKNFYGYVLVTVYNHPNKDKNGCVLEHRLVMEKHIGRYLDPKEVVHHINRIIDDNKLENLMLFKNDSEHHKYHAKLRRSTMYNISESGGNNECICTEI